MLPDITAIRNYFRKLGFEPEIADIYLALHTHGPQTISELSRNAQVERTRIYRLIDRLLASSLIEIETQSKRGVIKAAPIINLRLLITQKGQELKSLEDELELIQQVLARNSLSSPAMRVQFYQGHEGIRQMLWNELNATGEIVGYDYRAPVEDMGKKFIERWTEEFKQRKLACRLLSADNFSGAGAAVTHSCHVYDNVVAYYHWKDGEIFGTEMHNPEIANTQRIFIDAIWAAAYSPTVTSRQKAT